LILNDELCHISEKCGPTTIKEREMKRLIICFVLLMAFIAYATPTETDVGAGCIYAIDESGDAAVLFSTIAISEDTGDLMAFPVATIESPCKGAGYMAERVVPPDIGDSNQSTTQFDSKKGHSTEPSTIMRC
jgi:hypothetical protein